ncbi:hypothetical protein J7E76_21520 [Bacillus sp. ISL-101]|nr:hypothetical protein [Bacillus sp. ISL-101]MBT2631656.1 hypothetical protein [Bacillus sp. ISL-101]MBT2715889.1 hypothetical protein [Bacillus sp. ISL-57]
MKNLKDKQSKTWFRIAACSFLLTFQLISEISSLSTDCLPSRIKASA